MDILIGYLIIAFSTIGGFVNSFIPGDYLYVKENKQNVNISSVTDAGLSDMEVDSYNKMVKRYNFYQNLKPIEAYQKFDSNTLIQTYPENF